jgi:hypothetical protein
VVLLSFGRLQNIGKFSHLKLLRAHCLIVVNGSRYQTLVCVSKPRPDNLISVGDQSPSAGKEEEDFEKKQYLHTFSAVVLHNASEAKLTLYFCGITSRPQR